MSIDNLAAAIERKYGACADTAVHKDGTFEITRWDAEKAGVPPPSDKQLLRDIEEYEAAQPQRDNMRELQESDTKMNRVQEDIIDMLISKGVIQPADLPDAVIELRQRRRFLRQSLVRD